MDTGVGLYHLILIQTPALNLLEKKTDQDWGKLCVAQDMLHHKD